MKFLILTIFFANNFNTLTNDNIHNYNYNYSELNGITNVFYSNPDNDLLFVDFANIDETVKEVILNQDGNEIMVEDVVELEQDIIYELDLSLFPSGTYQVELILENNKIIKNSIVIP